jgi:hypothetical protein
MYHLRSGVTSCRTSSFSGRTLLHGISLSATQLVSRVVGRLSSLLAGLSVRWLVSQLSSVLASLPVRLLAGHSSGWSDGQVVDMAVHQSRNQTHNQSVSQSVSQSLSSITYLRKHNCSLSVCRNRFFIYIGLQYTLATGRAHISLSCASFTTCLVLT